MRLHGPEPITLALLAEFVRGDSGNKPAYRGRQGGPGGEILFNRSI